MSIQPRYLHPPQLPYGHHKERDKKKTRDEPPSDQSQIILCWCVWAPEDDQEEAAPVGDHGKVAELPQHSAIKGYKREKANRYLEGQRYPKSRPILFRQELLVNLFGNGQPALMLGIEQV